MQIAHGFEEQQKTAALGLSNSTDCRGEKWAFLKVSARQPIAVFWMNEFMPCLAYATLKKVILKK